MTSSITWLDSYTIGINNIDQQHKYLFVLINKIIECDKSIKLQVFLEQLLANTKKHFKAEEQLMEIIGYSDYKRHQEQHALLIQRLDKKSTEDLSDALIKENLNNILVRYLFLHIIDTSLKLDKFLQTNFPPQKTTRQWYSLPEQNYNQRTVNYIQCISCN